MDSGPGAARGHHRAHIYLPLGVRYNPDVPRVHWLGHQLVSRRYRDLEVYRSARFDPVLTVVIFVRLVASFGSQYKCYMYMYRTVREVDEVMR